MKSRLVYPLSPSKRFLFAGKAGFRRLRQLNNNNNNDDDDDGGDDDDDDDDNKLHESFYLKTIVFLKRYLKKISRVLF